MEEERGISMNVIIVAAIALLVLVILSVIFIGRMGSLEKSSVRTRPVTVHHNALWVEAMCDDGVICYSVYREGISCLRDKDLIEKYCEVD